VSDPQIFSKRRRTWLSGPMEQHAIRVTDNFTKMYPPQKVILEAVEGCELRCTGCGIASIRHRSDKGSLAEPKFLPIEAGELIATEMIQAHWTATAIVISGRGETTLHPDLPGLIRTIRKTTRYNPIHLYTSGAGLQKPPGSFRRVMELFDAGLNFMLMTDRKQSWTDSITNIDRALMKMGVTVRIWPDFNRAHPDANHTALVKHITLAPPPEFNGTTFLRQRNLAGAGMLLNPHQRKRPCPRPFREMFIRYDGNVPLCQDDWRGVYKCGNVVEDGLVNVWNSKQINAARQLLINERREITICRSCDSLMENEKKLPDFNGLLWMKRADAETHTIVESAQAGTPYTKPVELYWE
jgi:radical SAM protein with 4Fe4S-binding SPASM domain